MKPWTTAVALALLTAPYTHAQTGTEISYQGELTDGGALANGSYDMDFSLWDAFGGGSQVGSTINMLGVTVNNGRFTVELDFGANAFDNSGRWLQIDVNGAPLLPRQAILRTPYAIQTRGIFVDEINNVGVGTMAPEAVLHVEGNIVIGGPIADVGVRNPNNPTAGFGLNWAGDVPRIRIGGEGAGTNTGLDIQTVGNRSLLRILDNGNVGIGTTSPAFPLHIRADQPYTQFEDTGGGSSWSVGLQSPTVGFNIQEVGVGTHVAINEGGNIGIGTTSPDTTLHVIDSGSGGYGAIQVETTFKSGLRTITQSGSSAIYAENLRASGNNYQTIFGLSVGSDATTIRGDASGERGIAIIGWAQHAGSVNYGVWGRSDSATGFDFFAAGAGTNYGASSSRRWKKNIENISDPLVKIARLRGVYFDWDAEHGGQHDVGMIAEEVGAVLPEIVQYEETGIDAVGMDYSKMAPLLVEAVNALRTENELLRTRLETVEAALQSLTGGQIGEENQ